MCGRVLEAAGNEEGGAAVAALTGGDARATRLAAAGAARAALPLLLVDHAPADAAWEALELYPQPQVLAQACAELCQAKGWRRAVLLHEGDARGAALLTAGSSTLSLLARQLPRGDEDALLRSHTRQSSSAVQVKARYYRALCVQELAAGAEEVRLDKLHRVVLGGVQRTSAGRGAARGTADREALVRSAVTRPAHAAAA